MTEQKFTPPSLAPVSIALASLTTSTKWSVENDYDVGTIQWHDEEIQKPSDEAIVQAQRDLYGDILLARIRVQRSSEYPPITDYIDGVVKGDQAQIQAYIDACLAVKAKYPKPEGA